MSQKNEGQSTPESIESVLKMLGFIDFNKKKEKEIVKTIKGFKKKEFLLLGIFHSNIDLLKKETAIGIDLSYMDKYTNKAELSFIYQKNVKKLSRFFASLFSNCPSFFFLKMADWSQSNL